MPTPNSSTRLIYLDNQATTQVDPAVIDAMLPLMATAYANPGSVSHRAGRDVAEQIEHSTTIIADSIHAAPDEIVYTSGATESNNLALFGFALHPKQTRRKIISMSTEHRALLDPLARLQKLGFEIVQIPCIPSDCPDNDQSGTNFPGINCSGIIDLERCLAAIDDRTALVSVMLANNEIGTIQPIETIAKHCAQFGVAVHTDASQAVGKIPIDVQSLGVDLLSFSAHKFYGPKGIGGLYVRSNSSGSVRLQPQILGGGHQRNMRSGTLNSAGIIGMAKALEICQQRMHTDRMHYAKLRNRLWQLLTDRIDGLLLNGPRIDTSQNSPPKTPLSTTQTSATRKTVTDHEDAYRSTDRLDGNLNVCFPKVDGQSMMLALPDLAVSSGSACTSAEPHPSHVLLGIGRTADQARASLRFGIGRFNTIDEIDMAADWISEVHTKLASLVA